MITNFTQTLGSILESYSFPNVVPHDTPWNTMCVEKIVADNKKYLFDFSFPWYNNDKDSLDNFETMFCYRFYMEQIGFESVGLFKQRLQSKLLENMDRWTKLFKSTEIEYDPLINRRIKRNDNSSYDETSESTLQQSGGQTLDSQAIQSSNPEVTVSDNNYASNLNRGKERLDKDQKDTSNYRLNHKNSGEFIEEGFVGESPSDNIIKYRQAILSINKQICDELSELFLSYLGGEY